MTRFGGDKARASAVYASTVPLTADDVGEAAGWLIGLAPHMNVNLVEVMPICPAPRPLAIKRS